VEGLVHISELSYKRVTRVSHVVEEGQEVEVKVLTIDPGAQRIGLSLKAAEAVAEAANDEQAEGSDEAQRKRASKRPAKPLRGGVGGSSGGETFGLKW
jgi:small subunit ribosomal protein S1